jgi:cysteine desulfurase/selenocysteine lyase
MTVDLSAHRDDFPIFQRRIHDRAIHFLDSAASAQKPSQVLEAMDAFARTSYANVHRGAYTLSLESTERYEEARTRVASLLNAPSSSEIVLTRGATTALNMIASGWGGEHLRPRDRVLLTTMEHHADIVPWQMVARRTGAVLDYAGVTPDFRLDFETLHHKLDSDVRIVAITGMSNVLGTMPPLAAVVEAAHAVGAVVVVDAAQLVPHAPVDVQAIGADFLVFSGHKMLGPTGIGALWGRTERLAEMEPFEGGGEMISNVELHSATWAPIPHRFEAGTPPIIEAVGLTAAIDYVESVGLDRILAHDRELTSYALERLAEVPDLVVYGPDTVEDRGGVISFTMGDVHPHDLATILDQEGVSVRAGHHCAKPLMRVLDVPATTRASFHLYNTPDDVDALVAGLDRAASLFRI